MPKRITPTLISSTLNPTSQVQYGTAGQQTEARLLREAPTISAALRRIEQKEAQKTTKASPPKVASSTPKKRSSRKKRKKAKHFRCCIECELRKRGWKNLSKKDKKELEKILATFKHVTLRGR